MDEIRYRKSADELHRLIERYFEGTSTLAEEARLRSLLADPACRSAEADEARAVMGLFACARRSAGAEPASRRRHVGRTSAWVALSAAASVAVIVCAVLSLSNISVGNLSEQRALAKASRMGMRYGHDSIAQLMEGEKDAGSRPHHALAVCRPAVINPEDPDEVEALISSEMGYMAEAEQSMYKSIADDFGTVSGLMR